MVEDNLRVLIVDDDPLVTRVYQTKLTKGGWSVETAGSGLEGLERVKSGTYDVILSDISMPGMTGLEFLRAVRKRDLDVPVVLMTGNPGLDSAIRAVEYGAFRYLTKPVDAQELSKTLMRATRLHRMSKLKQQAQELELPGTNDRRIGERAALEVRFEWGVSLMWMAFQPIVDQQKEAVLGYEALVRSDEPLMLTPGAILDAAERLDRVTWLGRKIRACVAAAANDAPEGAKLFVNLHAADLNDDELFVDDAPLSKIANRVVLEVTERASLYAVSNVPARVERLRAMGYQIAVDDLGAGYSGLTTFTQFEPEIAKLDISIVRGIDGDERRQSIVRSMKKLCDELEVQFFAEGVETLAERRTLASLGCHLQQGFLYGKPERGFRPPIYDSMGRAEP